MVKKSADQWFEEYGVSHQNKLNKLIHWVCVPLIYLVIFGLLWDIPQPDWMSSVPFLNWATLISIPEMALYYRLSPSLAKGLGIFTLICLISLAIYEQAYTTPLWITSLIGFIILWIGQFVGHHIEGAKPSFFKDVQFLLIGPAWLMGFIYRKFGIHYD
jgi:uncharacterized membrane protein YGL010W